VKLLQIAFIAVLGTVCFATYVTSETLHAPCYASEQELVIPAPDID
jgi:hypothetical protein